MCRFDIPGYGAYSGLIFTCEQIIAGFCVYQAWELGALQQLKIFILHGSVCTREGLTVQLHDARSGAIATVAVTLITGHLLPLLWGGLWCRILRLRAVQAVFPASLASQHQNKLYPHHFLCILLSNSFGCVAWSGFAVPRALIPSLVNI